MQNDQISKRDIKSIFSEHLISVIGQMKIKCTFLLIALWARIKEVEIMSFKIYEGIRNDFFTSKNALIMLIKHIMGPLDE